MITLLAGIGVAIKLSFAVVGGISIAIALWKLVSDRGGVTNLPGRELALPLLALLVVLLPWSIRGIQLSGYPVYPSTIASFDVSWRVPIERVDAEVDWIRSWARWPGKEPQEVLASNEWVRPWLRRSIRNADSIALFVTPGLLVIAGLMLVAVGGWRDRASTIVVILPSLTGILFWLVSAPDPRFLGASLWVVAGGLLGAVDLERAPSVARKRLALVSLALAASIGLAYIGFHGYFMTTMSGVVIEAGPDGGRHPLRQVETKAFTTKSGLVLWVPRKGSQCWDARLPCTPYPAPRLALRRTGDLSSGFELR